MGNTHRGDTPIVVGGAAYILCYDLNATAMVMDHLGLTSFEQLADGIGLSGVGMSDLIYIMWAGLQHHHPDLTEKEVGALDWDISEAAASLGEAFQKGLARKTQPSTPGDQEDAASADPPSPGTGSEPS